MIDVILITLKLLLFTNYLSYHFKFKHHKNIETYQISARFVRYHFPFLNASMSRGAVQIQLRGLH